MQRTHSLWCLGVGISLIVLFGMLRHHAPIAKTTLPIDLKPVASRSLATRAAYAKLPIAFESNQGQVNRQVLFLSHGPGYNLFLTSNEAVLSLHEPRTTIHDAVLRMKLLGASPHHQANGQAKLPGSVNYFIGNNPTKWRTNVATYSRVEYRQVYPGIDMVYYGNQQQLEYDWVVAPGADPNQIRLGVKGAEKATLTPQGDLLLHTACGDVIQHAPVVYQEIGVVRKPVSGRLVLQDAPPGGKEICIGFEVAAYDHTKPLVIDPVLVYSTYLGGTGADTGRAVALDSVGNAYVTGATSSTDFPVVLPYQSTNDADTTGGDTNVFVYEMNASGTAMLYATYLGGSVSDQGNGIAVDSSGNAYLTGFTRSTDFPTQNALYSTLPSAGGAAFITRLNAGGATLGYSTYLGGSSGAEAYGIAVDSSSNAYVAGGTTSTDFPTVSAFQTSNAGGSDAFVTEINSSGSSLLYSTYLGGSGNDTATGIALDSSHNIYITGNTVSTDFPLHSAMQATAGGGGDAFVTAINSSGATLIYSTYLGGSAIEHAGGIAVDGSANAYITGDTHSTNFPVQNAYQATNQNPTGASTAFVTKLSSSGSLANSTYLGGTGGTGGVGESGHAIAVDSSGDAYVTGSSYSTDFPLLNAIQTTNGGNGDAFVSELASSGSALVYSTCLGGTGTESGSGIAVDSYGNAFVTGSTQSADFPIQSPLQHSNYSVSSTNSFLTCIGRSNWQTVGLTVGSDAQARLLWSDTTRTLGAWSVNASGQGSNYNNAGPFPGYTAQTISGGDGINWLLWNKTDGSSAVWILNPNNALMFGFNLGPFPGWRVVDVAADPAPSSIAGYILWTQNNGEVGLWLLYDSAFGATPYHYNFVNFGPYPGWTATHIAHSVDGYTRLLWTKNDGTAELWILNYYSTIKTTFTFGPYPGWRAIDVAVGSDNLTRLLWSKSDGTAAIWTVTNTGSVPNYTNFGPFPGWNPTKIASGGGMTWLLWSKGDGTQALWTLDSNNTFTNGFNYGPY